MKNILIITIISFLFYCGNKKDDPKPVTQNNTSNTVTGVNTSSGVNKPKELTTGSSIFYENVILKDFGYFNLSQTKSAYTDVIADTNVALIKDKYYWIKRNYKDSIVYIHNRDIVSSDSSVTIVYIFRLYGKNKFNLKVKELITNITYYSQDYGKYNI